MIYPVGNRVFLSIELAELFILYKGEKFRLYFIYGVLFLKFTVGIV